MAKTHRGQRLFVIRRTLEDETVLYHTSGMGWTQEIGQAWVTNNIKKAHSRVRIDIGYDIEMFTYPEVRPTLNE